MISLTKRGRERSSIKKGVKKETAVGTPDFCPPDNRETSKMTKEAAGAKKAEADGEILRQNDFSYLAKSES